MWKRYTVLHVIHDRNNTKISQCFSVNLNSTEDLKSSIVITKVRQLVDLIDYSDKELPNIHVRVKPW